MMFELGADGKFDREIAMTVNAAGYRTTGTRGPRSLSNNTVRHILSNKFYTGYIPDGNGGWTKAKHEPLIDPGLFERVQQIR
jgi:hypothetical protein